jgi:hypothetical protein
MNLEMLDNLFPCERADGWDQWGRIHDAVLEAVDINLTAAQCKKVFLMLPREEQGLAISWGLFDTVFGDEVFTWAKENKYKIEELVSIG